MTVKLPELWLQYASDDLKSAKVLLAEEVYNITCFHAQQAVEQEANMAYSHAKDIDTVLRMLVRERINSGSMPKDDII